MPDRVDRGTSPGARRPDGKGATTETTGSDWEYFEEGATRRPDRHGAERGTSVAEPRWSTGLCPYKPSTAIG